MKFGHTIIYVSDIEKTFSFYENAFKLKVSFAHESKEYCEFDTGATKLAFASEKLEEMKLDHLGKIALLKYHHDLK